MEAPQLPYEILLHISAFTGSSSMLQQLLLYRPFYEYYVTCRQYCIQLHTVITTSAGNVVYTVFGKRHREDGPAVEDLRCSAPAEIHADDTQEWYWNGKLHLEDGPAIIFANGTQYWYCNGKRHRDLGPAIIFADSAQHWYQNGKLHREDGPATIYPDGMLEWYRYGKRHREDGPASIYSDGSQYWYRNGKLHLEYGPAVED